MGSVCFIVDTLVTGANLPRHLQSIRGSGIANHLLPILVTGTHLQPRLSDIEQRYHTYCLITPALPLGTRLNKAAFTSQAEWLIIALQKQPIPAHQWELLYQQLNTHTLDALLIGPAKSSFSERILRRMLTNALLLPSYIAVRQAWLERLGGFDPDLDNDRAIEDFLQRLYACPTRLKTYRGHLHSQISEHSPPTLTNGTDSSYTPRS